MSYFGSPTFIQNKIKNFSHQECNTDENPNFIESSMVYSTRTDDNVEDYDIKHTFDSKEYSIAHTLDLLYVDRNTQQVAVDGNNKEHAVFLKLEPEQLRLEQLVHISEIADSNTPCVEG